MKEIPVNTLLLGSIATTTTAVFLAIIGGSTLVNCLIALALLIIGVATAIFIKNFSTYSYFAKVLTLGLIALNFYILHFCFPLLPLHS